MTMNDTWGYKTKDNNWKSAKRLIHDLVDAVSRGVNYLLNVGPTSVGLIPGASISRLPEIGKWLEVNKEAIYKTEPLKEHFNENIRYTKNKGNDLIYAVLLEKPKSEVVLKYVKPNKNSKIFILGNDKPLEWAYEPNIGLKIDISQLVNEELGVKYTWTFKIYSKEIAE